MRPKLQKQSAYPEWHLRLKIADRNETQTLKAKCIKVCQSNYPIAKGYWKLSREVEDNATSRGLHRIPPPAEAGGFQTAGLKTRSSIISSGLYLSCFTLRSSWHRVTFCKSNYPDSTAYRGQSLLPRNTKCHKQAFVCIHGRFIFCRDRACARMITKIRVTFRLSGKAKFVYKLFGGNKKRIA